VEDPEMKKWLGLFGLLGAIGAAVMFFRRQRDDDEFLDEELE
jgi:LPXTG-motif cell wall-anchored protein